jgi:hypothetical protein
VRVARKATAAFPLHGLAKAARVRVLAIANFLPNLGNSKSEVEISFPRPNRNRNRNQDDTG